jgi:hypothetical protein
MSPFVIVLVVFLLVAVAVSLFLLKKEQAHRQADGLRWEKQRLQLQQESLPAQRRLERLISLLKDLYSHTVSANGHVPRQELADAVVDAARALLQADAVVLLQLDGTLELTATAGVGFSPEVLGRLRIRPGQGPLGRAAQSRTTLLVEDPQAESMEGVSIPYMIVPLIVQSRPAGLLIVSQPQEKRFSSDVIELAGILAGQAGICMENLQWSDQIDRSYGDMIHSLARAIDAKDAYTHGHSDRTHQLVRALAEEIHLPEALIRMMEYGALLHDIGKIGIEDAILRKPGKLTPEEYTVMKRHPEIGHRILQPVRFLRPVASIVLYHQEWVNGGGYPEGLAGEEIPLGARLVAVIDAWDAMTSNRPYRQAMTKAAAIAELRRAAGTQFDSKLVDAFLRVLERFDRDGLPASEPQEPSASSLHVSS